MFILTPIEDTLRIAPQLFARRLEDVLRDEINAKYSNRVIPDVGLGVALYDLLEVVKQQVFPGDGAAHVTAVFRLAVFRPFEGEVIEGQVKSCTKEGVQLTLSFFESIFVPFYMMAQPSTFDEAQQCWVWQFRDEESDAPDPVSIELRTGDVCRVKVAKLRFSTFEETDQGRAVTTVETSLQKNPAQQAAATGAAGVAPPPGTIRKRSTSLDVLEKPAPPVMKILARTNEPGLGAAYAWDEDAGGGEEEEPGEEEEEEAMAEEEDAAVEAGGAAGADGAFDTFAEEE